MNDPRLMAAAGSLLLNALVLAALTISSDAPPPRLDRVLEVAMIESPKPLTPQAPPAPLASMAPPSRMAERPMPAPPPAREPVRPPARDTRRPVPVVVSAPIRVEPKAGPPVIADPGPQPASSPVSGSAPRMPTVLPAESTGSMPSEASTQPVVSTASPRATAPARSAVSIDASYSGNLPPPYPALARRMGESGQVWIDVQVGADGVVRDVRITKSSGSSTLDQAALDTVRRWRFKPATVDGTPVSEWYRGWKWTYKLED